ncbi:MAG: recombination regulator RecX [Rhodocyclaceae bacterium]|nr:recombination regulator RecX [Rhodocyclaceae bacterium]
MSDDLRGRAIRLLARREHSRAELMAKLAPHGSEEEIDHVLTDLQGSGLLSDARFAEAWVRSRATRDGLARLRQSLRQKGIADHLIATAVDELPDELGRAREVWAKKFGAAPADAKEWAKQARFLQGRGFSVDVIRRLLKNTDEEN